MATGDAWLAGILFALAVFFLFLAFVPQAPSDPSSVERWRIEASAQFGLTAEELYDLGFFSLLDAALPRVILALLAFLLLARAVERAAGTWERRKAGEAAACQREALGLLAHLGALLLLAGLLVGYAWGWRASGLIEEEGLLQAPGHDPVELVSTGGHARPAQAGVRAYVAGSGPTLAARATDEEGEPLGLQHRPGEPIVSEMSLRITPGAPEVYFAIPEAGLVVRSAALQANISAETPILVQVFRTPTGELVKEQEFVSAEIALSLDAAELWISRSPYRIWAVAYDPGLWLKVGGIVLGAVALLGYWAWPGEQASKRIEWAARPALAALTLGTAGLALHSLVGAGRLWGGTPFQAGISAAWAAALAAGLLWRPKGTGNEEGA